MSKNNVPKICASCGVDFVRPYSPSAWARVRTCSRMCGGIISRRDRYSAFEEKYIPEPNSGCWIWIGACDEHGYGDFWDGTEIIGAHRASYQFHCGKIPDGGHVLHSCDFPPCVNPDHLFLGDHVANMADMVSKNRHAAGERHGNCKLDNLTIDYIRRSFARGRDIAAELGISESYVSQLRSGQRRSA